MVTIRGGVLGSGLERLAGIVAFSTDVSFKDRQATMLESKFGIHSGIHVLQPLREEYPLMHAWQKRLAVSTECLHLAEAQMLLHIGWTVVNRLPNIRPPRSNIGIRILYKCCSREALRRLGWEAACSRLVFEEM